jgi:hypothetical protein
MINNIFSKRAPIITYGNEKAKLYVCTFQEIYEFSSILHLPEIQGDLNNDKIEDMINSYKINHHFMASKALLTIAKIQVADEIQYCLVDGQHRLDMIKQLYETEKVSDFIMISFINVESNEELNKLFLEINTDSSKCIYKNLTIFDKENYADLTKKINEDNELHPMKKSRSTSKVYTTSQFVEHLISNKILERLRESELTGNSTDEILKFLKVKEKEFFILFKYDSKKLDKVKFANDELTQINYKSCIFMKNNNFLEYIFDPTIEPFHDLNIRLDIKPQLRKDIWNKYNKKQTSYKCPIIDCKNIMIADDSNTWHAGHIISHCNKGPTDITNLKPICPSCNKKMNYKNWNDYEEEVKKNIILNNFFNGKQKIKCKCNNFISKTDYKIMTNDDNTIYPICSLGCNIIDDTSDEDIIVDTREDIKLTNKRTRKNTNKKTINVII